MKKNNLNLALANILILTLMFSVSSTSFAQNNVYKWRLAETWPKDFPVFGDTARNFMQLVKEMSGGRLLIEEHTSEKHKKPLSILEMVRDGEYEMGHTATHYAKSLDLKTILFTAIPFGMIAPEKEAWFDYGGGNELMKKVYDQYGINAYLGGNTGTQMGGWFKKEINSEADLVGLKIRIPGLAGNVMETLGVNVTNLPPSELYDALESGKIDAVEWVGPSMDIGMGFHKIAPFYYTGWHEPGSTLGSVEDSL